MDDLERMMRSNDQKTTVPELDVESLIQGTGRRIHSRARRRRIGYSGGSLAAIALIFTLVFMPGQNPNMDWSGELILADLQLEWYDLVSEDAEDDYSQSIYWSSLGYLIESDDLFIGEENAELTGDELDAFAAYLEEV